MKIIEQLNKLPIKSGEYLVLPNLDTPYFIIPLHSRNIFLNAISLVKPKNKKGWIKHKKNQCIFSVAYGEINFKLIDDRKNSKTFGNEENIKLNKNKHSVLILPPGIWFSFSTNKKKSILVNLINSVHSDNETLKSKTVKNYYIK